MFAPICRHGLANFIHREATMTEFITTTRAMTVITIFVLVALAGSMISETGPANAQEDDAVVARCSQYHRFGGEPVDIAKTADLSRVLARAHWGYNAQGNFCYLTLDGQATRLLRENAGRLPDPVTVSADRSAVERCSEFHRFGGEPVDIVKTADLSRVLARAHWGYNAQGNFCYLRLDDAATSLLQDLAQQAVDEALTDEEVASIVQDSRSRHLQAVSPDPSLREPCEQASAPDRKSVV